MNGGISRGAAVLGAGYRVPQTIRYNDDPIFAWLREHSPEGKDLFKGYKERRVLAPGETLMDLMLPAAQVALEDAALRPDEIDMLTGHASVSAYRTPNELVELHAKLGLRQDCWLLPLGDDFTNALSGSVVADAAIRAGTIRNALVVAGCNYTRYSNYHKPQAVSSSDGAGAVVIGALKPDDSNPDHWRIVDALTSVQGQYYGGMYMAAEPIELWDKANEKLLNAYSKPWYHINELGIEMFKTQGMDVPPKLVKQLLAKHGLSSNEICLCPYQGSSVLLDYWEQQICPGQVLRTLEEYANMTLATIPVNFAKLKHTIAHDYLIKVGVGPGFQAIAVLLWRNGVAVGQAT